MTNLSFFYILGINKNKNILIYRPNALLGVSSREKKINIEVEITKKTEKRYKEIIFKSSKDGADYILYVVKKKEDVKSFAEYMPRSNKLMFIDIDSLIFNIKTTGKINPIFQEQLLLYDEV